jgi:hypothetical protein
LKNEDIGEMSNALTEFHDILEVNGIYIFLVFTSLVGILGISILLVIQIGWIGLVGVAFSMFCEFIHYHFADYNASFLEEVN